MPAYLLTVGARPIWIVFLLSGRHQTACSDVCVNQREVLAWALKEACLGGKVCPNATALQQGDGALDPLADGGEHLLVCWEPTGRRRVKLDTLNRVWDAAA